MLRVYKNFSFFQKNLQITASHHSTAASTVTSKDDTYIKVEKCDHGVRKITLKHNSTRNSISLEMLRALSNALTFHESDDKISSIVITADESSKIFSAGHNLKELSSEYSSEQHRTIFELCSDLMETIPKLPVPVIATVDGLAAAAGCQLVASCDIVICTERSSFSTPGANFGIFCSTPGIPLVRNVPKKVAAYMLFSGFAITSQEALNAGLVSKVVPDGKLDEAVGKLTMAIDAKSRAVTALGKRFLQEQMRLTTREAYEKGNEVMINNLKLADAQEGIRSFVEKRKPVWDHRGLEI